MKVTTKSGFKCDINDHILEDWRLMAAISDSQADDPKTKMRAAVEMVRLILGDSTDSYFDYIAGKNENHIVPEEIVTADILSIINKIKALKN